MKNNNNTKLMKENGEPFIFKNRDDAWLSVCFVFFQKFKNPMTKKEVLEDAQQTKQKLENDFYKLLTMHLIGIGESLFVGSEINEKNPLLATHNVTNRNGTIVYSNYNFTVEATNVNERFENTLRIYPKDHYSLEWYCADVPMLYALEKTLMSEKVESGTIKLGSPEIVPFYLDKKPAILFRWTHLEISFEIADYIKFGIPNEELYKKAFGESLTETLKFLKNVNKKKNVEFIKKWLSDVELILNMKKGTI